MVEADVSTPCPLLVDDDDVVVVSFNVVIEVSCVESVDVASIDIVVEVSVVWIPVEEE